jgi:hypothetical protein
MGATGCTVVCAATPGDDGACFALGTGACGDCTAAADVCNEADVVVAAADTGAGPLTLGLDGGMATAKPRSNKFFIIEEFRSAAGFKYLEAFSTSPFATWVFHSPFETLLKKKCLK